MGAKIQRSQLEMDLRLQVKKLHEKAWLLLNQKDTDKWKKHFQELLGKNRTGKEAIVFLPSITWNTPLMQRPHLLAQAFARLGNPVFYCEPYYSQSFSPGFHMVTENLFVAKVPLEVFIAASDVIALVLSYNSRYLQNLPNAKSVYEYIDDLSVFAYDQEKLQQEHNSLLKNAVLVTATARRLLRDVQAQRPDAILCQNGVDYDFFHSALVGEVQCPLDMRVSIQPERPVIGYYGALAKWFDYELLTATASVREDCEFILIGPDFDNSIIPTGILDRKNVHWLGARPYRQLPEYLKYFDAAMIPFVLNDITHSTSPLKLFEFFAGGKPVITTAMEEVSQYPGVLVVKDAGDFSQKITEALSLAKQPDYLNIIDQTARANTWETRARQILSAIHEKTPR